MSIKRLNNKKRRQYKKLRKRLAVKRQKAIDLRNGITKEVKPDAETERG